MSNIFTISCLLAFLTLTTACSTNRKFSRGEFEDTQRVNLLSDKFSESTAQLLSRSVAEQLKTCKKIDPNKPAPNVAIDYLENQTEEMINLDMVSTQIGTALVRSGRFEFIDKKHRDALEEELKYNETGVVSATSRKTRGNQIGVDLLLFGILNDSVQEVGHDKTMYYKLYVHLTDVNTGKIVCVAEQEVRAVYKKNKEAK